MLSRALLIEPLLQFCLPGEFILHYAREHGLCGFVVVLINCCVFLPCSRGREWITRGIWGSCASEAGPQEESMLPSPCEQHLGGKADLCVPGYCSGSKEVATIHPNTLKVRVWTSYPLPCALLVRLKQLPMRLCEEVPFIHTDGCFLCFNSPQLDQFKDLPECLGTANTSIKGRQKCPCWVQMRLGEMLQPMLGKRSD